MRGGWVLLGDKKRACIGFVGAGKAGVSLGAYFRSKGLEISGYLSRSRKSAISAAELTSSKAFTALSDLVTASDIIIVSTPDGSIAKVWKELRKCDIRDRIVCHLSGSLSSDIFDGIEAKGSIGYSVHPMFAFGGRDGNFEDVEKAFFTIEGAKERLDEVREIFLCTGNRTFVIDKKQKHLYHVSNVMVSNLVTALLSLGTESFERCGVSGGEALEALLPLIKGNIENIAKRGFPGSLTGPVERNDTDTIMKHLDVLGEEERQIYSLLSKKLAELSKVKHPGRDQSKLLELLEKYNL